MASLQYVIDSICSSVTPECVEKIIEAFLSQGPFSANEILPLIRSKDRSLDISSAKMIADAALEGLAARGTIRVDGDYVYPAT